MKPAKRKTPAVAGHELAFREIISFIAAARSRAFQAVNTELIEFYWRITPTFVAPVVRQIQPVVNTLTSGKRFSLTPDFSRVLRSHVWIETVSTVLLRDGKPLKRFGLLGRRNHPAKAGC